MARWYGYSLKRTRKLLITEFFMLDGFLARHPPLDMLEAWKVGYKAPDLTGAKPSGKHKRRVNSEALAALPPRKKTKTLAQMPAFLRGPESLAMIEGLKAEWQTNSE